MTKRFPFIAYHIWEQSWHEYDTCPTCGHDDLSNSELKTEKYVRAVNVIGESDDEWFISDSDRKGYIYSSPKSETFLTKEEAEKVIE
jgi:hypothetical protein